MKSIKEQIKRKDDVGETKDLVRSETTASF